jgi:hypothetical protein
MKRAVAGRSRRFVASHLSASHFSATPRGGIDAVSVPSAGWDVVVSDRTASIADVSPAAAPCCRRIAKGRRHALADHNVVPGSQDVPNDDKSSAWGKASASAFPSVVGERRSIVVQ